jgi:DNA (cytosine-5)-methyltransferase 1
MGNAHGKCGEEQRIEVAEESQQSATGRAGKWSAQPGVGRIFDGVSARLDRHNHRWPARPGEQQYEWESSRTIEPQSIPDRSKRLKALGNAVVPQVVEPIARAILECLQEIDQ